MSIVDRVLRMIDHDEPKDWAIVICATREVIDQWGFPKLEGYDEFPIENSNESLWAMTFEATQDEIEAETQRVVEEIKNYFKNRLGETYPVLTVHDITGDETLDISALHHVSSLKTSNYVLKELGILDKDEDVLHRQDIVDADDDWPMNVPF